MWFELNLPIKIRDFEEKNFSGFRNSAVTAADQLPYSKKYE